MDRMDANTETPRSRILGILSENRIMAVATLRSDGWPQATMVGYMHDGLTLYFATARSSQKLANIVADPRISIAIGRHAPDGRDLRGLSMAATANEVTDFDEVRRLNAVILERYPEQEIFTPRGVSVAILKVSPLVVSVIDPHAGLDQPVLLRVNPETGALLSDG